MQDPKVTEQLLKLRKYYGRKCLLWYLIEKGKICEYCLDDLPDHKQSCTKGGFTYGQN